MTLCVYVIETKLFVKSIKNLSVDVIGHVEPGLAMALPLIRLQSMSVVILDILSAACLWLPSCCCTLGFSGLHLGQWP